MKINNSIYKQSERGQKAKRSRHDDRKRHLKKYGLSLEDYNNMLVVQHGVCVICGDLEKTSHSTGLVHNLSVDHNHQTGKVRGLLCHHCNTGLGGFKDNILLLEKAIQYLKMN